LGLAFFGLTFDIAAETRAAIFKQIHQVVFHGKGGYDWHTVYNMPIWLRRFTFQQINNYYEEEKSNSQKSSSQPGTKTVIGADGKIKAPEYISKAKNNKTPVKYK
jgi:hypothetical protein